MSFWPGSSAQQPATPDAEIPDATTDSISSLAFSPTSDILAVASWDHQVRLYEIGQEIAGKAAYAHEGPALDVCWSSDGTKVYSAGADNAARAMDLQSGATCKVATHEATVRCLRWTNLHGGLLVTGSWDKTVKYWDLRTPDPVITCPLEERCYALDVSGRLLVVAAAERKIQTFDLQKPGTQLGAAIDSPLKFQTRSIACFPDGTGYAIGSIEGRVAIQYIDQGRAHKGNFSFKCHRTNEPRAGHSQDALTARLHSVNAISFHPVYGTFSTAGSDGTISFWDKTNKTRLKTLDPGQNKTGAVSDPFPVTATAFNHRNGSTIFAYATSYDWARGYRGLSATDSQRIMLHSCKEDDIKEKPKA